MLAKAIERQTHAVEQITIHNDKVALENGHERDVTFVHAVLTPIPDDDDCGGEEKEEEEEETVVREVLDDLVDQVCDQVCEE